MSTISLPALTFDASAAIVALGDAPLPVLAGEMPLDFAALLSGETESTLPPGDMILPTDRQELAATDEADTPTEESLDAPEDPLRWLGVEEAARPIDEDADEVPTAEPDHAAAALPADRPADAPRDLRWQPTAAAVQPLPVTMRPHRPRIAAIVDRAPGVIDPAPPASPQARTFAPAIGRVDRAGQASVEARERPALSAQSTAPAAPAAPAEEALVSITAPAAQPENSPRAEPRIVATPMATTRIERFVSALMRDASIRSIATSTPPEILAPPTATPIQSAIQSPPALATLPAATTMPVRTVVAPLMPPPDVLHTSGDQVAALQPPTVTAVMPVPIVEPDRGASDVTIMAEEPPAGQTSAGRPAADRPRDAASPSASPTPTPILALSPTTAIAPPARVTAQIAQTTVPASAPTSTAAKPSATAIITDAPPVGVVAPAVGAPVTPLPAAFVPELRPVDTGRADWVESFVERIDLAREAMGARTSTIRLVPDALGMVEIRIREDAGALRVALVAETAQARGLLTEAAPRLGELAGQRGLRIAETSIAAPARPSDTAGTGSRDGQPRSAEADTGRDRRHDRPDRAQPDAPASARAETAADTTTGDRIA